MKGGWLAVVGAASVASRWTASSLPGGRGHGRSSERLPVKPGRCPSPEEDAHIPFCPNTSQQDAAVCVRKWKSFGRKGSTNQLPLSLVRPPAPKPKQSSGEGTSSGGSSDDYAYPPPPVPAYSLPNSPVLYKKATGGHSRTIPTPGRSPSSSWTGTNPPTAHTAPSSPASHRSTQDQGVCTLVSGARQGGCPSLPHGHPRQNGSQKQAQQTQKELARQPRIDKLQCNVQTAPGSIERGSQDVCHLGRKMAVVTEMISGEENAQALNLLAEVVDKLQGLIVASKVTPPRRRKQPPPPPPLRFSSMSPKVVRKAPTPYPCHLSSSSCSSSSSFTSVSSCAGVRMLRSPERVNGGARRTVGEFGATRRVGVGGRNGQARPNNTAASRDPEEDQHHGNSTGCLTTKKKKKNKGLRYGGTRRRERSISPGTPPSRRYAGGGEWEPCGGPGTRTANPDPGTGPHKPKNCY
ncbi:hypothetical protein FQN60_018760 [Etheostoma spectabile]|uniref:Uncharacterized protein n=1 Tax=Etheostoma spectabile TaxID=54343 RepID=A0A5J5CBV6_9PERO|nr:hypothetical protein FQN60_018760 [Etheostoma spectabile]